MCEGASKQTPDLKILPRRDHAPTPRFELPGSATDDYQDSLSLTRGQKLSKFYNFSTLKLFTP